MKQSFWLLPPIFPCLAAPTPKSKIANPEQELAIALGRSLGQCLQATGADMNATHLTIDQHLAFLHVSIEATLDMALREANMIAKLRTSSANFTFCHDSFSKYSN